MAAPAPWIPSVISSGDSEPSEDGTLPVVSVPYIDNSPAETAPVYAAPIGTAPTVGIPFEQISDSGYDAIGEIPGFAPNSESAEIGGTSAKAGGGSVCEKSDRVSLPRPGSSKVDCGNNSSNTGRDIADGNDGTKNVVRTQLNDTNGTFDKTPADRP